MSDINYGWVGKILKVDLTKMTVSTIPTSKYVPKFIGGRGVGAMLYWEEVPPECRAFDPENALIMMTGPVTGTLAPSAGKFSITCKSPVNVREAYCLSVPGGHWGPELKFAGYDGIVVKGKATEPVYLWIHDGKAEIHGAKYLWGNTVINTMFQIYRQHGPKTRVLCIGPAGENLCREAAIIVDGEHATGIGGAGAVMGSKNLKAIAVLGTQAVKVANPQELMNLWWHYARLVTRKPGEAECPHVHKSLTEGLYHGTHIPHCPGHPKAPGESDEAFFKNNGLDDSLCLLVDYVNKGIVKLKRGGCYCCPINCILAWQSTEMDIPSGSGVCNGWMSWATWEWAGYGKVIGPPTLQFNTYITNLGLSATNTLGYHFYWFLKDLVNLGIITKENTGLPIDNPWSLDFIKEVLEQFAYRKGVFGKDGMFAMAPEGAPRFLKSLAEANPAVQTTYDNLMIHPEFFANGERAYRCKILPTTDAIINATETRRWKVHSKSGFNGFMTLIRDGQNLMSADLQKKGNVKYLGSENAFDVLGEPKTWKDKVPAAIILHNLDINADCITYCSWASFPAFYSRYTPDKFGDPENGAKVFSAVTGINMTHKEMIAAMDPIYNIERCIHVREGRRREHDTYNDANFNSPEWAWTNKDEFNKVMDEYYTLRGWDLKTGIPKRSTLEKQGLKKIADELETKYSVNVPA
jgi:aldehyde:ferredoxin oxidoreductase